MWDVPSLAHGSVKPAKSGASHSAKEVLFQGNVTYTRDPEYIIGAFATLTREFTRTCLFDVSFFQIDVVCLPRLCGAPPLAHSASRSNVAVVYGKGVTYTCDLDYTINPKDVSSTTSSCGITFHIKKCSGKSAEAHFVSRNLYTTVQSRLQKQVGRRGWKAWSEGVVGRRGRKAWSENLLELEGIPSRPNETRSEDFSHPPLSSSLEFTETKTRLVQGLPSLEHCSEEPAKMGMLV